jgi:hydrogenase maturation protease
VTALQRLEFFAYWIPGDLQRFVVCALLTFQVAQPLIEVRELLVESSDPGFAGKCVVLASPWDATPYLEAGGPMIIIDACKSEAASGTIHKWPACGLPADHGNRTSSHGGSLAETFALARSLGDDLSDVVVYGIEAAATDPGAELSPAVRRRSWPSSCEVWLRSGEVDFNRGDGVYGGARAVTDAYIAAAGGRASGVTPELSFVSHRSVSRRVFRSGSRAAAAGIWRRDLRHTAGRGRIRCLASSVIGAMPELRL